MLTLNHLAGFGVARSSVDWSRYTGGGNGAAANGPNGYTNGGTLFDVIALTSTAFLVLYASAGSTPTAQVYSVSGTAISAVGSQTVLQNTYACSAATVVIYDASAPTAIKGLLTYGGADSHGFIGVTINPATGAVSLSTHHHYTDTAMATLLGGSGYYPADKAAYRYATAVPGTSIVAVSAVGGGYNPPIMFAIDCSTPTSLAFGAVTIVNAGQHQVASYGQPIACWLDSATAILTYVDEGVGGVCATAVTRSGTSLAPQSSTKVTGIAAGWPIPYSAAGAGKLFNCRAGWHYWEGELLTYNGTGSAITKATVTASATGGRYLAQRGAFEMDAGSYFGIGPASGTSNPGTSGFTITTAAGTSSSAVVALSATGLLQTQAACKLNSSTAVVAWIDSNTTQIKIGVVKNT